jgi:hypothetical protein
VLRTGKEVGLCVCIFIWRRIPSEIISQPEPGVVFEHSLLHSNWSIRILPNHHQGTFREHSGNIPGTFREHSGNLRTFREHLGNMRTFKEYSGKI